MSLLLLLCCFSAAVQLSRTKSDHLDGSNPPQSEEDVRKQEAPEAVSEDHVNYTESYNEAKFVRPSGDVESKSSGVGSDKDGMSDDSSVEGGIKFNDDRLSYE